MSALEELLDNLDATRERTLVALETLPDEALLTPGVIGRWSIADLLSILTAWDAEVVTGLLRLQQGQTPEKLLAAVANPDRYNVARYEDAQGRDLDVIFADFQGARLHLEEWLSELSERALTDPKHFKALAGQSLGRLVARATYEQEARYLPFLAGFAERWEPAEEDDPGLIAVAGIDVFDPLHADHTDGLLSANGDGLGEMDDDE
jgi:hypothetical protein